MKKRMPVIFAMLAGNSDGVAAAFPIAAPKGAVETELTASLKRCPDTKRLLSAQCLFDSVAVRFADDSSTQPDKIAEPLPSGGWRMARGRFQEMASIVLSVLAAPVDGVVSKLGRPRGVCVAASFAPSGLPRFLAAWTHSLRCGLSSYAASRL